MTRAFLHTSFIQIVVTIKHTICNTSVAGRVYHGPYIPRTARAALNKKVLAKRFRIVLLFVYVWIAFVWMHAKESFKPCINILFLFEEPCLRQHAQWQQDVPQVHDWHRQDGRNLGMLLAALYDHAVPWFLRHVQALWKGPFDAWRYDYAHAFL